jgi:hypothetical protein
MSGLLSADFEMFARLGVSAELLDAAGIERVTDLEARNDYGITNKGDLSGILFPYFNGDSRRATCRLRRDHPEVEDGKSKNKYVAPFGDVRHLYFAPGARDLLKDPQTEIIFVEAEKSSLALTAWAERNQRKLVAIATGGCWGWRGRIGKAIDASGQRVDETGPLSDLYCVRGRKCTILFDANTTTNPRVEAARFAFAAALKKLGAASVSTPNLPTLGNSNVNGPDDLVREYGDEAIKHVLELIETREPEKLGSCSIAELFAAHEKRVDWLCWPFAAIGLATILDALPKVGKTVFILRGIHASLTEAYFLNFPTHKMRVVYVSEQSMPSLAMQMREIGFTGKEPIEELRLITREHWSRFVYTDFLTKLEEEILRSADYTCLVIDTLHTIARMEDERDASEVNKLGNLTLDVASRNNLALVLGRHDRKSGGEVGVSGRSSIQLSGLVDVILHLVRVPNQGNQRKLETISRVPGLPNEQIIELVDGSYLNHGEPSVPTDDRAAQVAEWLVATPNLTGEQIVEKFTEMSVSVSLATAKRYRAKAQEKGKP